MKRTPELSFAPDPAVRAGARIDELLADIPEPIATVEPDLYVRGTEGVDVPPIAEVEVSTGDDDGSERASS
jgi:hypothetical protein